jgi:hypothetical protein
MSLHLINVQMLFIPGSKVQQVMLGSIQWSVISGSSLGGWAADGGECAAQVCTLFIDCQSLRELRITSVMIIAIAQVRCGWDSSVMAL